MGNIGQRHLLKLPIDIFPMTRPDQVNDLLLRIDFVNDSEVTVPERIAASFFPLEWFALEGVSR
jgi:hypothetical protein